MSNVGFVGLGIMGKPMALNLIKGGHTLFLHTRSGVAKELTDAGGKACASAKEVAQQADIIMWDPLESTCRHASLSIL